MNYLEKVAHMLGVELEEEFYINGRKNRYRIINDDFMNLQVYDVGAHDWIASYLLPNIISGTYEIVKIPFKPKYDETYYYVVDSLNIYETNWRNRLNDLINWKVGNCFKTRQEAETKGRELMEKLRAKYENE